MLINDRRVVFMILLLIIVLAACFRFWKLDVLPPGLYHDEAYNGLDALSLIQGKTFPLFYEGWELYAGDAHAYRLPDQTRFPIFFEGNYGREPLHIYLMAISIAILDASPFAIRAVPALAGTLAVITTFLAAVALFNRRDYSLPLLAAFTMAILYPAVHFSRFGIRAMVFVPIETLVVACFWFGINRGSRTIEASKATETWFWFLTSGILLGLSLYTFAAARLFPLVWVLFVPLLIWIDKEAFSRFWRHIIGMSTTALLIALPLMWFFIKYPYYFVFRIAYVANKGKGVVEDRPWLTWLLNIGRVSRGLIYFGETHLRHNLPGRPYLDGIQTLFFLLGLLQTLRQIMRPRFLFLFLWFGIMLLPSILSGDAPHFGRLSGAAAPISILVALGAFWTIGKTGDLFRRKFSFKQSEIIALGLVIVLLGISMLWTANDYFVRYAQQPELKVDFYESDWAMGTFAAKYGENIDIYLSPTQEELATILFALGGTDRLRNYNGEETLVPAGRIGKEALYLVRQNENVDTILERLRHYFPGGSESQVEPGIDSYYVQADSPRNPIASTANHDFGKQIRLVGWSKETKENQLLLTLAWQAENNVLQDYTAFVHLLDDNDQILAQIDRQPAGYPTSNWRPAEIVIDQFSLKLPENSFPGQDLIVRTGFYDLKTLERLGEAIVLE